MKNLFLVFALFANSAHAIGVTTETKSELITNLAQVFFSCEPGVPWNGHNYPTTSSVTFANFLADSNIGSVYVENSFSGEAGEMGDHCAELREEFTKILPATMTLTRALSGAHSMEGGYCLNVLVETVNGKIGNFDLASGPQTFVLGTLDPSACANTKP
jgi:hypothetical protein